MNVLAKSFAEITDDELATEYERLRVSRWTPLTHDVLRELRRRVEAAKGKLAFGSIRYGLDRVTGELVRRDTATKRRLDARLLDSFAVYSTRHVPFQFAPDSLVEIGEQEY